MADPVIQTGNGTDPDLAARGEGMAMPETGTAAIETESAQPYAEPTALFLDPTGWVSMAMAIFLIILLVKGVPRLIGAMLDRQIAGIRSRLDEASQLRAEAEALRAEYAAKLASVEADAAAMIVHAEEEARAMMAKAEADAATLVRRRTRMAEDKIAAAERQAIADVRVRAADAAARAAAAIIARKHGAEADRAIVDRTIAGLGRPN